MDFAVVDFNGAEEYFEGPGAARWGELWDVLAALRPQLQASDQANRVGVPIFDPKGTNASLTAAAAESGWFKVPLPVELRPFGQDWDAGKGTVLAEWQFSNYPFLWNNITRTEAVFQSEAVLPPLTGPVDALVIVTKSGSLPASNSTLYFEQALAQIERVTTLGIFHIPIRLVGLGIDESTDVLDCDWNVYPARYARAAGTTTPTRLRVLRGRAGQYGNYSITFGPVD